VLHAAVFAQSGTIKGTIKTSDGNAAEFVNVNLKGTQIFAIANGKGEYEFKKIKPGSYILVASFTGLETTELAIDVKAGDTTVVPGIVLKENLKQLKEVVVTTQRRQRDASEYVSKMPLKNVENSQVYSVIDKQVLSLQQANSMEDAMKNATGVSVVFPATGRATDGGTYYTLRGFTTGANLTDGLAGAVYNNPDAGNIERVEVLKGPSATLFGSSLTSFGGAINVVTKKPYDTLGGSVSVSSGSWGLMRVAADFNTPVDKDKNVLFRVNAAYHRQNSFQDYGFTKRMYIAPSVSYKVNDKLSFLLQTNFSQVKATIPCWYYADSATTHVVSADKLKIDDSKYYMGEDLYVTTNTVNAMLQMNYAIDDKWKSQSVFSVSSNSSRGPSPYLIFVSDTSLSRNVQVFEGGNVQTNLQQNFLGNFNTGSVRHRLLIGADYYQNALNSWYKAYNFSDIVYTTQKNPNYLDYNLDNLNKASYSYFFGSWTGKQLLKRVGGYVSDVVNLTDNLILNVGLRYDYYMNSGYYDPTADTTIGKYDQGGFSPKAGLIYQLIKNKVSLFANYQNSFQNVNGQSISKETFKPEQANQYEGGVKFSLLQDRLAGTVSYYDITVTNSVRTDPSNPLFSVQDGTQRSKGVEAEVNVAAYRGLTVTLGYGYNDNKYTKADAAVEGLRPVESGAAHLAHAFISYAIPSGRYNGLGLSFGGNYSSKKYTTNDKVSGIFYIPAYTVLNASAYYDQPRFRIAVNVNNLTSERYWVGWNNLALQKPRELVASVTWKF
jgi:iron complex outermembrane receptor protein